MAKKIIRTGTTADPTGDSLKNAFIKVNDNFTELYNALGLDVDGPNIGAFEFSGSVDGVATISTTDSSSIVIDQQVTITSDLILSGDLLPSVNFGGNIGSPTKQWRSLYVSNNTIFINNVPLRINAALTVTEDGDLFVDGRLFTGGSGSGLTIITPEDYEVPGVTTLAFTGAGVSVDRINDVTTVTIPGGGSSSTLVNGDFTVSLQSNGSLLIPIGDQQENESRYQGAILSENESSHIFMDVQTDSPGNVYGGMRLETWNSVPIDIRTRAGGQGSDIKNWRFDSDGALTLPLGGTISYTPDDTDNWNGPAVNTVQAALDELAARVTALQNLEIDGGNAYTPPQGEFIIDGNGA